ncbi:transposable element Tcb2 transposase [Trichonephila clavipes]|nr:transposable element Tcb2 transposase [Trichonephila clavipes]
MARRNHLDDFSRGRTIGKLEEGRTVNSVAAEFGINKRECRFARLESVPNHRYSLVQRAQKLDNCQWGRILFTDESRFSTRSDSQRVLIWRENGTRFYTSNFKERHHYGGPGVIVWGGIMLNGRTELHIFDRVSVIGDRYCEEVLLPYVRLFRGAIGPDFIFMDDNAWPHRTLVVKELLESEDITRMDWPAYSPDLNPIEHVWYALGRRIATLLHHPENTQQLKQMLIVEWALLPQEMLHTHRTARLQWCREHHNWTEQDWACVLFSDESRFSLSSDCRRQLIWRESGTAYRPENIQEKDRYPTCSIMVWAGIIMNGRTHLQVVANGTLTGQRYIDEVLLPHDCQDSEGIQRLVWLACSPNLSPIENVWDALGRQVAGRNYPPTNKNILIRALKEEWDKLPQPLLDNVVQSMRKIEELTEILNVNKVHIACLQETKLNPNLKLKIKGFTTLRKDRKDRAGGGLAFLIKSADIKFREITLPPTTDYDENSTEVQAIIVLLPQQEVTIINAYHPDNSDINLDLLNTLLDTKSDTKILLEDINAKSPSWGSRTLDLKGSQIEDLLCDNDLSILNDKRSTYLSKTNGTTSALDITAINHQTASQATWKILKSAISDHFPIITSINQRVCEDPLGSHFENENNL